MFDVLYPCYNKKTPDHLKQSVRLPTEVILILHWQQHYYRIITDYGGSIVGSNEVFDPETGVITRNAVVYAVYNMKQL